MLAKFLEDQISIVMSLINYLNFKFLWSKIIRKRENLSFLIEG